MLIHLHRARVALVGVLLATACVLDGSPAVAAEVVAVPPGGTVVIHGRGFGHGHGMSQYGAQGAAEQGLSTRQILEFYYPRTKAGEVSRSVTVLVTENIGRSTTVVARPGLQVRDLSRHATLSLPTHGPASRATLWRMTGAGDGGARVSYKAGSWHPWRTLKGNGEFRSTGAHLTLVLAAGRVSYRGTLLSLAPISPTTHRITVNRVSLEAYVQGVVPREMPASWRPAALRAQAVAARTYAAYEAAHAGDPRFDLCDSSSCQVYGGLSGEVASTNAATAATAGQVRTYQGQPAFTQFSASNGGWASDGGEPYLRSQRDPYDTAAVDPYASWKTSVSARAIQRAWPALGKVTSIADIQRDGNGRWGGRITSLTLHGTEADKDLSGDEFRIGLGLRSTWLRLSAASP